MFELRCFSKPGRGTSVCLLCDLQLQGFVRRGCRPPPPHRLSRPRPCSGWSSQPVPFRTFPCLSLTAGALVLPSIPGRPVSLEPGMTPGDARVQWPGREGKTEQEECRDHGECKRARWGWSSGLAGWGWPDGADAIGLVQ